jgi:hypothetical protein
MLKQKGGLSITYLRVDEMVLQSARNPSARITQEKAMQAKAEVT